MTPDERQLLSGLFDRIRGGANQPRDREAETFIGDAVRTQPYAPYLMAQTVIVQEQALRAASEKLQQLEAQLAEAKAAGGGQQGGETSFLGNLGKSLFGAGGSQQPPRPAVPTTGGYGPAPLPNEAHPYNPQTQPRGPWGNTGGGAPGGGFMGGMGQDQGGGGGFLKGALGAAAGVAGGVLLADSIRGLFGGVHNPYGIASGFDGGGFGAPGGETVVNNYYENGPGGGGDAVDPGYADDAQQDYQQDVADGDLGGDSLDPGTGGDDGFNV